MRFRKTLTTLYLITSVLGATDSIKKYIVAFKEDAPIFKPLEFLKERIGRDSLLSKVKVENEINNVFKGFVAYLPESIVPLIKELSPVYDIVEDGMMKLNVVQNDAPWGLARISQHEKVSGNKNNYKYKAEGGEGVTVYVIDSGVYLNHEEFEGRAVLGKVIRRGSNADDENGHGTHVAGTIGGKTYGVAKKAEIVAVKVFGADGSGSNSDVIAAIDWVVGDKRGKKGNVINMSLGGPPNLLVDLAAHNAYRKGFVVAVAAGNSNQNACLSSPANTPSAITVGATNITDFRAYFSNYGSCVDLFAPGQNILSSWIGSKSQTKIISGTSMATPHVAGLAAYLMSLEDLNNSQVTAKLKGQATKDKIQDSKRTPNLLIYNGGE